MQSGQSNSFSRRPLDTRNVEERSVKTDNINSQICDLMIYASLLHTHADLCLFYFNMALGAYLIIILLTSCP